MKKTKTLHLITAAAASAVLAFSGCSITDSPDYGQTTSETVTSGSLAVTADKVNLDPGDTTGVEAEFTLSLTGATFAFGAEADADLSGYVSIKALDSDGSAVSTVKTDKVLAKNAFEAGATSVTVYTTITDSGESDIVGNLAVSVSSGALKGSGKVSNTEKEIEVATCEIAGVETTLTSGASIANNLISIKGGTSLAEKSITLYLIPKGKTAGYKYNGSADTDITADFDMIDTETGDSLLGALGLNGSVKASPATYEGTDAIKIVITGGTSDAASWLTQSGTFVFTFADSDLVNASGTAFSGTGTRTFMTTNDVWAISGASVSLSGDVLGTTVTGYGTVGAKADLGTLTATVDAGGAEYSVTSLTITDGTNTWTSNVESDNVSFKPVITKDLSSSADNLNATLSFVVNATIDGQSATLPATDEVTVSLNYKSYLENPTAAQVLAATGSDTTAEVYTTVINLATFDDIDGVTATVGKSLSANDEVATFTIGENAYTATALEAVTATATEIPVKITYTGTAPTGEVSVILASGIGSGLSTKHSTIAQTNVLHLAKLAYVEDFTSADSGVTTSYITAGRVAAKILDELGSQAKVLCAYHEANSTDHQGKLTFDTSGFGTLSANISFKLRLGRGNVAKTPKYTLRDSNGTEIFAIAYDGNNNTDDSATTFTIGETSIAKSNSITWSETTGDMNANNATRYSSSWLDVSAAVILNSSQDNVTLTMKDGNTTIVSGTGTTAASNIADLYVNFTSLSSFAIDDVVIYVN